MLYPAIFFLHANGIFNPGSFIIHALLPGTSKTFTLSLFCHMFMSFCQAHDYMKAKLYFNQGMQTYRRGQGHLLALGQSMSDGVPPRGACHIPCPAPTGQHTGSGVRT